MYQIFVYIPATHVDEVKKAMFKAGAGVIGSYDRCCWQVLGEGQFRASQDSEPTIGEVDDLVRVEEYRVDMLCASECLQEVINDMKQAHPYKPVVYGVIALHSS